LSNESIVTEVTATGEEIAQIIAALEMAADGAPRDHLIIALISMALVLTYPEITQEQLRTYVREVSRYICLLVDPASVPLDSKQLN